MVENVMTRPEPAPKKIEPKKAAPKPPALKPPTRKVIVRVDQTPREG